MPRPVARKRTKLARLSPSPTICSSDRTSGLPACLALSTAWRRAFQFPRICWPQSGLRAISMLTSFSYFVPSASFVMAATSCFGSKSRFMSPRLKLSTNGCMFFLSMACCVMGAAVGLALSAPPGAGRGRAAGAVVAMD
jgi:hypothetical protein